MAIVLITTRIVLFSLIHQLTCSVELTLDHPEWTILEYGVQMKFAISVNSMEFGWL